MLVQVDPDRCEGHARCIECAPQVFEYDDVTNIAVARPEADLAAHRDAILEAAYGCPEHAITVSGD